MISKNSEQRTKKSRGKTKQIKTTPVLKKQRYRDSNPTRVDKREGRHLLRIMRSAPATYFGPESYIYIQYIDF